MEKEYNPALQFDAFTAGIEDGGLRSSSSIAILACYIIARSEEKLTKKTKCCWQLSVEAKLQIF